MFGTLVAIEAWVAFSTIPDEPLVDPATAWVFVVGVVGVAAALLWLVTRGVSGREGAPLWAARRRTRGGKPVRLRHAH